MVNPMPVFFDMAVKHSSVRAHAQLMPLFVYLQPLVGCAFVFTDNIAYFLVEYLGTSAGYRFQTGFLHHFHARRVIDLSLLEDIMVFNRRKRFHMQFRAMCLDLAE